MTYNRSLVKAPGTRAIKEWTPIMNTFFIVSAALSGAVAVALGAFGAHGLRQRLSPDRLAVFETAVRYQLIHALALLFSGYATGNLLHNTWIVASGWFFLLGTLIFSGSLYLLVFTGRRAWGAVTPVGGLAFIFGWLCLALAVVV